MNILFSLGQKVVCVDAGYAGNPFGKPELLIEGKTYTIHGINKCPKCGCIGVNVGITQRDDTICKCGVRESGCWYNQFRFVAIDTDRALDEEIHNALKETLKINQ